MYKFLVFITIFGVVVSVPTTKTKEDVRIVGGEDIDISKAPYQISLVRKGRHSCGGSIIAKDIILTAAHCVYNSTAQGYSVRAGSSSSVWGGELYPVQDLLWHPDFTYSTIDSDVALLKLSKPLRFNERVLPIKMMNEGEEIQDGGIAMVTGWGNLKESGGHPSTLQMVLMPIVDSKQCNEYYSPAYTITPTMLCAGVPEGGKDACQGDSGGPLVHNGKLAGVVSWGLGCARPNYPGVYAKVSALRTWIDQSITYLRRKQTFKPFPLTILDKLFNL